MRRQGYSDFSRSFRNKGDWIRVKKNELEREELWTLGAKKTIATVW
jgi:hypothetical protein